MLIGQLVGLVGIFLLIAVFQVNDRRKLLFLQIISCLTWSVYYIFMGAFTAAGLIFLGAVRCYFFDKYRHHEWLLSVTLAAYGIMALVTWQDWTSILALLGMTTATIAFWQKSPRQIRSASLFVIPFWLPYNILNASYIGAAADLITFSSVVLGILRFDVPPRVWRKILRRLPTENIEREAEEVRA